MGSLVLAVLLRADAARADNVDDLVQKLRSAADYKVRLSAAVNLGKLGDKRAIPALTDALDDNDKTVRGVAAAALGKMVDSSVMSDDRERAIDALARVAQNDSDSFVRSQAQKSYDALKSLRGGGGTISIGGKGVYVEIGPMADSTKSGPNIIPSMRKTVADTIGHKAPSYLVSMGEKKLSDGDLKKVGANAFYVDGTLVALTVARTQVSCKVSVVLATYPQRSLFGFAKGDASVDAGSTSPRAIADATSDCIGAVLQDLVERQIMPTIKARTGI